MRVKSMRGKTVDMGALLAKNENKRALGNANMNARGDEIDTNGKVVRTRDQIAKDYYASNPKAVKNVSLKSIKSDVLTPEEAVKKALSEQKDVEKKQTNSSATRKKAPASRKRNIVDDDE